MSIKVRYFASLKETLGCTETIVKFDNVTRVSDVWLKANQGCVIPDNILAAVNMDYAPLNAPVNDGDEVAFFPPVTGG